LIWKPISLISAALLASSGSIATARCTSSAHSMIESAIERISSSKLVTSNSMIALAVCCMVDRIVHRRDETLHVGPIKRSDKGGAQTDEHLAGDCIRLVLEIDDLLAAQSHLVATCEHCTQRPRSGDNNGRMALKQRIKLRLTRHQAMEPAEHQAPPPMPLKPRPRRCNEWKDL
jgi:hypothetical protein